MIARKLQVREVHVWIARLNSAERVTHGDLLGEEERERAMRLLHEADRRRYIAAHAFLRQVLSSYVGASPGVLEFRRTPDGKPELVRRGTRRTVSFSLSHARRTVAVGVARHLPVGVDVEDIDPELDVEATASVALSDAERLALAEIDLSVRRRSFYSAWVRKEAVLKATGRGLHEPPAGVEVPIRDAGDGFDGILLSCRSGTGPEGRWGIREIDLGADAVGAVAAPLLDWTLRCFDCRALDADATVSGPERVASGAPASNLAHVSC